MNGKNGRHVYCIIAHTDPYCLNKLVDLLDDERNDICLILDKKSELRKKALPQTKFSKLYTPSDNQLVDIQWGGVSQLKAELLAFSTAIEHGPYDYFHLISGQDLPLKSQDYIHTFFDSLPDGTNCISVEPWEKSKNVIGHNCYVHYLFIEKTRCKNVIKRKFYSLFRNTFIKLQKMVHYKRDWSDINLAKGHQWASITNEFAAYLVNHKAYILKRFKRTNCPDEIYKQSMIVSSIYQDTVYKAPEDTSNGAMRHIDWNRGRPYVWQKSDYDELMNCNELFARKFNSNVDVEIIDMIYARLTRK